MFDWIVGHAFPRLFDRGGHGLAHVLFAFAQRAEGDVDPQNVAEESDRASSAHVVVARQQADERRQSGATHAGRHTRRQPFRT